jgi:CDP-L-myo-inositol myo-inositolphosphotransferase
MKITLIFNSEATAVYPVASVPAIARVLREVALAGVETCTVQLAQNWQPPTKVRAEINRLAPDLCVVFTGPQNISDSLAIVGEALVRADEIRARLQAGEGGVLPATYAAQMYLPVDEAFKLLRAQERAILAATVKAGDGIVSRWLNRPISRTITRSLLAIGPVRPGHATVGTALLGVAMLMALIALPGYQGQIWGAIFFQSASIFDGVDGEIARATFRSSRLGATLDSMVDFITNVSFFAGLVYNLNHEGEGAAAMVALTGLSGLAFGKGLLGLSAILSGQPLTFDGLKDKLAQDRSRFMKWLTWLAMRDFYALAAAVLIVCGLVVPSVYIFTTIVSGWLVVVIASLARQHWAALNRAVQF